MSVNEVRLIGNLGNDPEVNVLPSGASAANFTVATSETWKDKQTGQKQEKTEWHRCKAFDRGNYKMAEYIGESCKKGTKIYIKGSLETREWEKDGIKRYTTEIKVEDFEVMANGIPKDGQAPQQAPASGFNQAPAQPKPQPQSFGSFNQASAADPWVNAVPAGEPAQKGATIEQIKGHDQVSGDFSKALALGWVDDGQIPF